MYPILFKIGPVAIYTYGFFAFLGVVSGYFVSKGHAKSVGINKEIFSHIVFWVIVFSFLGAKILYFVVERDYFLSNPLEVIRSGFVFYGAVIGGLAASYFLTKKYKINFLKFADSVSLGLPLGHAFGRLGCFFYGCCYGRPTETFIGILFPFSSPAGLSGQKVIPTQLISSFFLFLLFLILLYFGKRGVFDGALFSYYFIGYGAFRFVIEFFRGDPRGQILCFSTSQFISVILVMTGIFLLAKLRVKRRTAA